MNEQPTRANLFSGRREIRLADFHALLIFDTKHNPNALNDKATLDFVFDRFGLDFIHDAEKAGKPIEPAFDIINDYQPALSGPDVTKANILGQINGMGARLDEFRVKPGDVVFCYIEAEGTVDPATGGRTIVLSSGDRIDRDDLRRRLEFPDATGKRQTRLTVFITDNCSSTSLARTGHRLGGGGTKVWRSLYFGHEGTVDLNSTQSPQKSFIVDGESVFATAFRRSFDATRLPKARIDSNGDGLIDWRTEFFPQLVTQTQLVYRERLSIYYDEALGKIKPAFGALSPAEQAIISDMITQKTLTPELLGATPATLHLLK